MRKVLIVGGGGYVGCVLAEELLERGYAVRIFDRFYFGLESLNAIRDRVEIVNGDMRQPDNDVFDNVVAVINLGGLSNDPTAEYNPKANYEMNTVATRALAEECKRQGIRRYVLASSCSIYDRGVGDDIGEVLQDETSPVNPRAAYAISKHDAEKALLELDDDDFCPVILRKATVFGFSPRMRYDLVVNTFVKDAMATGVMNLHYGGEMSRPLIDVRDAALAHITCMEADEASVKGQIFNVLWRNMRISELALRVQAALRKEGVECEIIPDYGYKGVRNYRVSGDKIRKVLGFQARIDVEESVSDLVTNVRKFGLTDFENPRYYNIRWMRLLEEAEQIIGVTGSVFGVGRDSPASGGSTLKVV